MGWIADILVSAFIAVMVFICARRGFVRCILKHATKLTALLTAIFLSNPIACLLETWWGLATIFDGTNLPFVSGKTLLTLTVGVVLFFLVYFTLKMLDKWFQSVKENMDSVNKVDQGFGVLFGIVYTALWLIVAFFFIDTFNMVSICQLTEDSGSFIAFNLYRAYRAWVLPQLGGWLSAVNAALPKF